MSLLLSISNADGARAYIFGPVPGWIPGDWGLNPSSAPDSLSDLKPVNSSVVFQKVATWRLPSNCSALMGDNQRKMPGAEELQCKEIRLCSSAQSFRHCCSFRVLPLLLPAPEHPMLPQPLQGAPLTDNLIFKFPDH